MCWASPRTYLQSHACQSTSTHPKSGPRSKSAVIFGIDQTSADNSSTTNPKQDTTRLAFRRIHVYKEQGIQGHLDRLLTTCSLCFILGSHTLHTAAKNRCQQTITRNLAPKHASSLTKECCFVDHRLDASDDNTASMCTPCPTLHFHADMPCFANGIHKSGNYALICSIEAPYSPVTTDAANADNMLMTAMILDADAFEYL